MPGGKAGVQEPRAAGLCSAPFNDSPAPADSTPAHTDGLQISDTNLQKLPLPPGEVQSQQCAHGTAKPGGRVCIGVRFQP